MCFYVLCLDYEFADLKRDKTKQKEPSKIVLFKCIMHEH